MIRTLLTTTALVTILASGAYAQQAPAEPTQTPAVEAPATDTQPTDTQPIETDATDAQTTETEMTEVEVTTTTTTGGNLLTQGYGFTENDNLASEMIGSPVYSSAADDAEEIGNISDLVVDQSGNVAAVVIGVGGFLGIGEKRVAVDFSQLEFAVAADNSRRYVLATTREELEAAPEFQRQDGMAADTRMAPGADQPAMTADQPATTTQQPAGTAAQPADQRAFDPAAMQPIDAATLTADELTGTDVYGVNNEHIGTIGDLVLGDNDTIDAIIIDFGGFLGIGVKEVAVAYEGLNFVADAAGNRSLIMNITREQMEQAPEFNRDTYPTERDNQRLVVR